MPLQYSLSMLQAEIGSLLEKGAVSRRQPIYTLCKYIPMREWESFKRELEENDFLLRDPIGDLISTEEWYND